MSTTEVLRWLILSPTPPYFPFPRRPCCSCPACWPPNGDGAVPAPGAGRGGCYRQAVLILRWFLDGIRLAQLAADNAVSGSTAYRYLHEGIDALAAAAPGLRGALLAARAAGHSHV